MRAGKGGEDSPLVGRCSGGGLTFIFRGPRSEKGWRKRKDLISILREVGFTYGRLFITPPSAVKKKETKEKKKKKKKKKKKCCSLPKKMGYGTVPSNLTARSRS